MQPLSSASSGALKAVQSAVENPSRAGSSPSETGSRLLPSSGAVARLLQADPEANDAAVLASLTSRHGCTLTPVIDRKFKQSGKVERAVVGYQVKLAENADGAKALAAIEASLTPADEKRLTGWLAEMSVQCAFRQQTDFTSELTLRVYARNLSEYPADVVRRVLRDWPSESKWWPTWHELRERLEALSKPRRMMKTLLSRALEGA